MRALLWFVPIALLVLLGLTVYFAPTIVVLTRRRPNPMPVVVVNAFLGWTLLGWVGALAMAFHTPAVPTSPTPTAPTPTGPGPTGVPAGGSARGIGPGLSPGGS
ncbi:superinfection immunity protein [Euzebya sp.]|uniref:superinfection immunity protein n=1 Tax=Euzebya sp. TaxID=1971409 RepID=UPI00351293F6